MANERKINSHIEVEKRLNPIGYCYYCNERISPLKLFCSKECKDDYEFEQRRETRRAKD